MAAKKSVKKPKSKAPRAARAKADSLLLSALSPLLTVSDVETSLTWYRDVLGFQVGERWMHDGKLLGAAISAGKVTFMLGQDDWQKGRDRIKGQGLRLYCETAHDIDRLAGKIEARGGVLTQQPKDQDWGMRDFALEDPDGYKLTIAAKRKKKR